MRRWETYFYNRRFLTVSLIGVVFAMSDAITSLILFYTRELIATLPLKSPYHMFTRKNIKNLVRMKTFDWTILLIRSIFTICNIVASHILKFKVMQCTFSNLRRCENIPELYICPLIYIETDFRRIFCKCVVHHYHLRNLGCHRNIQIDLCNLSKDLSPCSDWWNRVPGSDSIS